MDTQSPRYLRARMDLFRDLLTKVDAKEFNAGLLRNGVLQPEYDEKEMVSTYLKEKEYSNEALRFTELCTFNTWFALHPEKVCGQEVITTSREFPITIKGDQSWVVNTIQHGIGDRQLLFDLPGEWTLDYFDADNEDFMSDYRCGDYKIQIFSHGVGYNVQFQKGDQLLENSNIQSIEEVQQKARAFMQAHPTAKSFDTELEIEALALEYELKLRTL